MLRRAAQEVIQARIQLRDVNGPRGGIDQQCRVTLMTHSRGVLVVTSRAQSAGAALAEALRRAVQSLTKIWQRKRRPDRQSVRAASGPLHLDVPQEALDMQPQPEPRKIRA